MTYKDKINNFLDIMTQRGESKKSTWFGVPLVLIVRVILSVIFFALGLLFSARSNISVSFHLAAFIIAGYDIIVRGIVLLIKEKNFSEEFLFSIAGIIAFTISAGYDGAAVFIIYQISFILRSYSKSLVSTSMLDQIDPLPAQVVLVSNGEKKTVAPDSVSIGDIVCIEPGERVPVDGVITEGSSIINLEGLLGKYQTKPVAQGDRILAGSVNESSVLLIAAESTVFSSQYSEMVRFASGYSDSSEAEDNIQKNFNIAAPFILGFSVLFCLLLIILTDISTEAAIHRALILLVCGGISSILLPVAFSYLAGVYRALRFGVLLKSAGTIDSLTKLGAFIFDRDDFLISSKYRITSIVSDRMDSETLLKVAAHCCQGKESFIADTIIAAYSGPLDSMLVHDQRETENGIVSHFDDIEVLLGDREFLSGYGIQPDEPATGDFVVYLTLNRVIAGYLVFTKDILEHSAESISALNALGCQCIMLSSADEVASESVAASVGVTEYYSQCLPIDRLSKIQEIKDRYPSKSVAYVSNSESDKSELSAADIGISLNGLNSLHALEDGSVVVMDQFPDSISSSVYSSRKVKSTVRKIVFVVLAIKILLFLLSVIGIAYQMWFVMLLDMVLGIAALLYTSRIS